MAALLDSIGILPLLPMLLATAVPIVSLAVPFEDRMSDHHTAQTTLNFVRRQNGNPAAAGDIYGLGLRVGAYLQIFGMLLSCIRTQKRSRTGILLLSSSVCISLFTAWTILVARRSISPCEAWLILSLSAAYGVPRFSAMNEMECSKGGIATVCCLVSILWQEVLYFWFFGTLYRELPLLGTSNRVWFFAPVDLDGWFRIFMLVVTCVKSLLVPCAVGCYLNMALDRFVDWSGARDYAVHNLRPEHPWTRFLVIMGKKARTFAENAYFKAFVHFSDYIISRICNRKPVTEIEDHELQEEVRKMKMELRKWRIGLSVWGFVVLILTIAGVEKIIVYNDLNPSSNLSQPGQNIPFILGIITLLVGASHAIKPSIMKSRACTVCQAKNHERKFGGYKLSDILRDPEKHFPEDPDRISEIDLAHDDKHTNESNEKAEGDQWQLKLSKMRHNSW